MDVPIIVEGAASGRRVATRFLIVATVITKQKTIFALTKSSDMMSLATKYRRSYAHFVTLSKRFDNFALIVVYAWLDISVESASYLMMICQKDSFTAVGVAYAGLEGQRISSIVIIVDVATRSF